MMAATEALSAGQRAINDVAAAFAAADSDDPQVPALLHASKEMLKLYDLMFPSKGKIYELLKKDHEGHIKGLEEYWKAHAGTDAVFALVAKETEAKGRGAVRGDLGSAGCSLLWLMRTFAFLIKFLDNLSDPALRASEAYECARAAYKDVLYPYHRLIVSAVVRLALGTVGTREDLKKNFEMPSLEVAYEYTSKCSAAMTPVKNKLHTWLKEKDMDWPDLVGI